MSALVWNQIGDAKELRIVGRHLATIVVVGLLGRAGSENIAGPSQGLFGDTRLASIGALLSALSNRLLGGIQGGPARKGWVAAEIAGGDRLVYKTLRAAQRPSHSEV